MLGAADIIVLLIVKMYPIGETSHSPSNEPMAPVIRLTFQETAGLLESHSEFVVGSSNGNVS